VEQGRTEEGRQCQLGFVYVRFEGLRAQSVHIVSYCERIFLDNQLSREVSFASKFGVVGRVGLTSGAKV